MLKAQQPIRLRGKAMEKLRRACFERDKDCVDKGKTVVMHVRGFIFMKDVSCQGPHELSHDKPRSLGGEDTLENCHRRCQLHHRLRDGHGCDLHF